MGSRASLSSSACAPIGRACDPDRRSGLNQRLRFGSRGRQVERQGEATTERARTPETPCPGMSAGGLCGPGVAGGAAGEAHGQAATCESEDAEERAERSGVPARREP